jgi:hypothetical protein
MGEGDQGCEHQDVKPRTAQSVLDLCQLHRRSFEVQGSYAMATRQATCCAEQLLQAVAKVR